MNINKAIKDLLTEKERLDRAIAHLEGMQRQRATTDGAPPKRRGRRTMDAKARREVSERMRRYWAMRRKESGAEKPAQPPAAN
jgi:hypothetical protein